MTETLPPTATDAGAPGGGGGHELARGTPVGRYIVIERLGQGGMGIVYKAYDPDLDRGVALKLVRADRRNPDQRQQLRARLLREAQALAKLSHPNVVTVHDVGLHGDDVFVAMELVEGQTLTDVLVEERSATRILELFVAAGRGLAAAHAESIVHRDFKPDNVIVGKDGQVRVLDFGLALVGGSDAGAGEIVGTRAYMAPEQLEGTELDARADQYSFCVALHEALFGMRPTADPDEIPLRSRSGATVSRSVRAALARGLANDRDARHPTLDALLAECTAGPGRLGRVLAAGAAVAVAAIAVAVFLATRASGATPCEGAAERLAGVWDAPRRAAVFAALRKHGDEVSASSVTRMLDRYTQAWVAMHTSSCRATNVLGEQSTELLDLRTECLTRRLAEVRHLTDLLIGADATVAARAVASVHDLAPLEDCANTTALRDPVPPTDRAASRAARDRFTQARALFLIGKYADAKRLLEEVAQAANRAGDRWLEASAMYLQARATRSLGSASDAEDQLYTAIEIAETGRASDVVADAWMTLAWIEGEDRGHYAEALRFAGVARGVLERAGDHPKLEAALEDHLGVLHLDRGALVLARHHLERGLALRERLYGTHDSEYAASLQHVAMLEQASGNRDKALDMHRRARQIAEAELGPHHPDTLVMLEAEGATLYELERYREASELLERGLAAVHQVAGADSEMAASFSINLGLARWKLRRFADARQAFETAAAIVARISPGSVRAATVDLDLALLLVDTGELDAARSHAERALATYEHVEGADHVDVAMALEALATANAKDNRWAAAVPALERALAIRTKAGSLAQDLAADRFDLAKALVGAKGDRTRARALAEQARTELDHAGDADGVAEVTTWLRSQLP